MNKKKTSQKELDDILIEFQKSFAEKIEGITTDALFEDTIKVKDQEILELKTLKDNEEIIKKLDDFESLNRSYLFRILTVIRMNIFRIPFSKRVIYHLRRWL